MHLCKHTRHTCKPLSIKINPFGNGKMYARAIYSLCRDVTDGGKSQCATAAAAATAGDNRH